MQRHLSQSFTVGEGAIVSQLITHFGYKIIDRAIQVSSLDLTFLYMNLVTTDVKPVAVQS